MHNLPLRQLLTLFVIILLIAAVVLIAAGYLPGIKGPSQADITPVREIVVPDASRTNDNTVTAQNSNPSALVSYVEGNFEPNSVTIRAGEKIRFVNNTPADLRLCGDAFDACTTMKPGEYWEYTFTKQGNWQYESTLQSNAAGQIVVE